jgi:hypothetical protein
VTTTAHAKKIEDVIEAATASASLAETLFSIFVVKLSLLRIAQYFIGDCNLLKL